MKYLTPSRQEPGSPTTDTFNSAENRQDGDFPNEILGDSASNGTATVGKLPPPEPWPADTLSRDPRIPEPLPHPPSKLKEINVREFIVG